MDQQIGRILDALDASGKADNTWIFFTSDHGLAVGQHGLMGKQNPYDHSVRVPFIVAGPGVTPGKLIDEPIYLQDVMPTTLELAGIDRPEHVEFQNLLPLLEGKPSGYKAIYGSYLNLQRSVRTQTHKLIIYPKADVIRLYDLQNDPNEMHDIVDQPESKPLVDDLFAELVELQKAYGDSLSLKLPNRD
jgi:choline-sulfatase